MKRVSQREEIESGWREKGLRERGAERLGLAKKKKKKEHRGQREIRTKEVERESRDLLHLRKEKKRRE